MRHREAPAGESPVRRAGSVVEEGASSAVSDSVRERPRTAPSAGERAAPDALHHAAA
ncbi:hypothetical protein [Streptomyces sp. NPDC085529]|uniref:hypothetical protein n=1 Tax=Streptomyces sp. NPDC085529 TaxID=3365729 RepID=UPI0037D12260